MSGYYDDNFGHWDGMEPGHPDYEDNLEFYKRTQRESVEKKCQGCLRTVRIMPHYAYCDSCATAREQGIDF